MKIYSMTATFGKLENQTLELQPGLNIIHAPNEWGKSTWCTFLAVMLYGLDTREKTTKNALAVKERYAPWSGAPMAGRMDLHWNGRDITIERWTKGRTPMGEFRAYETESGLEVLELTGANCGQTLLGVEKSVFLRAGYLRLADLPVTEDEPLRRRLNALVTTGDDSGEADLLAQKLKDLKNKCRSNRANGLIPQAEMEKAGLENKLAELSATQNQQKAIIQRQKELEEQIAGLENHKKALEYAAAEENLRRVAAAEETAATAARQAEVLSAKCADLPTPATAKQCLEHLLSLQQQQQTAQLEAQLLPSPPQAPSAPPCLYNLPANKAIEQVNTDIADYHAAIATPKKGFPLWLPAVLAAAIGAVLLLVNLLIPGAVLLVAGICLLTLSILQSVKEKSAFTAQLAKAEAIRLRYGGGEPQDWLAAAHQYAQQQATYEAELAQYQQSRQRMTQRLTELNIAIQEATQEQSLPGAIEYWRSVLQLQEDMITAQREQQRAAEHAAAIKAMAKPVEKPTMEDNLNWSEPVTAKLLADAAFEQKQLQIRLGQCQGRMDALGAESILQAQLEAVNARLDKLHKTYQALDLAMQTLEKASAELQRRFAPRISKVAQELFSKLTDGRYDRLTLQQDLSVNAAATGENVLHAAQWRSEGTIDQLYFALRLAVAKELTPEAPLILDDALVRFDDTRHAAAMDILRQEAEEKQIILFTCQSRENAAS